MKNDQIYEVEFPAIIPNYKVGPIQEPHQLNKCPTVSRKKRFITDIIGLGIQAFSLLVSIENSLNYRKA